MDWFRDFIRALINECLKLRRTPALRLTLLEPLLIGIGGVAVALPMSLYRPQWGQSGWHFLAGLSLTIWIFLLPLYLSLLSALSADLENRHHQWKHLFALPVARSAIYAAKQTVILWLLVLNLTILTLATAVAVELARALLKEGLPFPWRSWTIYAAAILVASLLIVALHSWLSLRWPSFVRAIGFGCLALALAEMIERSRPFDAWKYFPWLMPQRTFDSLPSTMPDLSILWASVVGAVVVTALGGWSFTRRDVFD